MSDVPAPRHVEVEKSKEDGREDARLGNEVGIEGASEAGERAPTRTRQRPQQRTANAWLGMLGAVIPERDPSYLNAVKWTAGRV